MKVALLTVFPRFFEGPLGEGMIRIARRDEKLDVRVVDLRDYTDDVHRTTDDTMYGGGAGMVLKCDPIVRAVEALPEPFKGRVLLTSARGKPFTEEMAQELEIPYEVGDITEQCVLQAEEAFVTSTTA